MGGARLARRHDVVVHHRRRGPARGGRSRSRGELRRNLACRARSRREGRVMLGQTLYVQWKWNRDFLAFYTMVAFAAPLIIFWVSLPYLGLTSPRELVNVGGVVGATTAVIAVLAGLTVAWQGYGVDDRAGHIYALSLPVTRVRALSLRAATAVLMLALPALGVWIGPTLA